MLHGCIPNEDEPSPFAAHPLTHVSVLKKGRSAVSAIKAAHTTQPVQPKGHVAALERPDQLSPRSVEIGQHPASRSDAILDGRPIGSYHPLSDASHNTPDGSVLEGLCVGRQAAHPQSHVIVQKDHAVA